MEIVFVRHAQPRWIVEGLNKVDPDLTDLGVHQAVLVADRLGADGRWDELLVSPTTRTRLTAAPIAEAIGIEPVVVEDLEELRTPGLADTPAHEVEALFARLDARHPDEWWDGFPDGEAFRDFHLRVTGCVADLLEERSFLARHEPHVYDVETDPGRIVVVGHAGTNAVAIGHLLGLDPVPWEWERFVSPHASVSVLKTVPLAGGHVFGLRSFGDVGHFGTGEVTR
ncbi:MAG TPA: histidine phosphatase family protein [Acidimicrobiia bacterium]|nr:histidine phosphatase family protein [Acidimicrobiia bacterium]